jgi:histidine kinase/DNA gyrase B/HSP90-like ATPase
MTALAASRLLRDAFVSPPADADADPRARLRASYLSFKERANLLAGEINRDFPDFTVHDGSHLDALWELADTVAGPRASLNPLDAYVLGGAILIHDLGLALASYPGGKSDLREEPEWSDALTMALERHLGRPPLKAELAAPPAEIEKATEQQVLRRRHAAHAEELASMSWVGGGRELFLIEDSELRHAYGPLIGQIAHSHWWGTAELPRVFGQSLGAPAWCPAEWTVDPLRLACLLRVCDALHLDSRRAPQFLRALREPLPPISSNHWSFQGRLARPYLKGSYLEFTAGDPFGPEDAEAWWLCHDTLRRADRWIREVQALLADSNMEPLAVQGVAGVENPGRLAQLIRTRDWIPVDTDIRATNVADLVLKLGGSELYGPDRPHVALRELIQNGADAVRARRLMEGRDERWGRVSVSLTETRGSWWLEVADTGVGMDEERLTGALVDFGSSFWGSGAVAREFPGLLAQGFRPTGRYGIGFFSVFMLGSRVEIVSRPYSASLAETRVLTFHEGVAERPILSEAGPTEQLGEGGTRVRVRLDDGIREGLLAAVGEEPVSLERLCSWLCPALAVDLWVKGAAREPVIRAGDWLDVKGGELLDRISGGLRETRADEGHLGMVAENLELVRDPDGTVVGRAALLPLDHPGSFRLHGNAVVTVGGMRSMNLTNVAGVLVGEPITVTRDEARPIAAPEALADWATRQGEIALGTKLEEAVLAELADFIFACEGDIGELPVALSTVGWLRTRDLEPWLAQRRTVIFLDYSEKLFDEDREGRIELAENVLMFNNPLGTFLYKDHSDRQQRWPEPQILGNPDRYVGRIQSLVIERAAVAWGCSEEEVVKAMKLSFMRDMVSAEVGTRDGEPVVFNHLDAIVRPAG